MSKLLPPLRPCPEVSARLTSNPARINTNFYGFCCFFIVIKENSLFFVVFGCFFQNSVFDVRNSIFLPGVAEGEDGRNP